MTDVLDIEILVKTFEELPIGLGVFHVPDFDNIYSIRYVFINDIILNEMHKTKEEVFGKTILEVAPEAYEIEGGRMVIETYRDVAKEGKSVNLGLVEYSSHIVAGTYECSIHPLQNQHVYIVLRNVTELEKTKNELELKNKELSQFAYLVAHDLKEPLRTVSSYVQFIKEQYQEKFDGKSDKIFGFITKSTTRMTKLITDLLDYSRVGKSKAKTEIDCNLLLQNIQQDLFSKINETNTTFHIETLPTIKAYETEIRVLFQNLISNAIKYTKPQTDPIIHIQGKATSNSWHFVVKDNGIGIDTEDQKKIFKVFHRLHSKSDYEGSGIGLAHCKKIIDLHQGNLWVDSKENQGSTFHFTIPKN